MPVAAPYSLEQLEKLGSDTQRRLLDIASTTDDLLLIDELEPIRLAPSSTPNDFYRLVCRLMPRINECRYDARQQKVETLEGTYDIKSRVRVQWLLIKYALLSTVAAYFEKIYYLDLTECERDEADVALNLACSALSTFPKRSDGLLDPIDLSRLDVFGDFILEKLCNSERDGFSRLQELEKFLDEILNVGAFASSYSQLLDNSVAWTNSIEEAVDVECSPLPYESLYLLLTRLCTYFVSRGQYNDVNIYVPAIDLIAAQQLKIFAALPLKEPYSNAAAIAWHERFSEWVWTIAEDLAPSQHSSFSQAHSLIKPMQQTGRISHGLCFGVTLLYAAAEQRSPGNGGQEILTRLPELYAESYYRNFPHDSVGGMLCADSTTRHWFLHLQNVQEAQESQYRASFDYLVSTCGSEELTSSELTRRLEAGVAYWLGSYCTGRGLHPASRTAPWQALDEWINGHATFIQRDEHDRFHFFDPNLGSYRHQTEDEVIRHMNLSLSLNCVGDDIQSYGWRYAAAINTFKAGTTSWDDFSAKMLSILADERPVRKIWYENGTRIEIEYVAHCQENNTRCISATVTVDRWFTWTANVSPHDDARAAGLRAYDAWRELQAATTNSSSLLHQSDAETPPDMNLLAFLDEFDGTTAFDDMPSCSTYDGTSDDTYAIVEFLENGECSGVDQPSASKANTFLLDMARDADLFYDDRFADEAGLFET